MTAQTAMIATCISLFAGDSLPGGAGVKAEDPMNQSDEESLDLDRRRVSLI
jgi:hypothetical protein